MNYCSSTWRAHVFLIPPQAILRHDRRTNIRPPRVPPTRPLTVPAAPPISRRMPAHVISVGAVAAAPTSPVRSQRTRTRTRASHDRTVSIPPRAIHAAVPLMHALPLLIPPGHKEHRRAVYDRAGHDADADANAACSHGTRRSRVPTHRRALILHIARAAWVRCATDASDGLPVQRGARQHGDARIDHAHERLDRRVVVDVERGIRVQEREGQWVDQVAWNIQHRKRCDVAERAQCVVRLQILHDSAPLINA